MFRVLIEDGLFFLSRRCIVIVVTFARTTNTCASPLRCLCSRIVHHQNRRRHFRRKHNNKYTHALLRRAVVRSAPRVRSRRKTVSSTHDEAVEKIGPLQREKRRLARVARKDDDGKRRHGSVRDARLETAHVRRPRRDGWIRPETVRREKRPQ